MPESLRLPSNQSTEIALAFGFKAPRMMLRLFELVAGADRSVDGGAGSLFQLCTGLTLCDQQAAHRGTPPELFIFGSTGVDDVNVGCVIHDQLLGQEFALAAYNPSEARADYVGLDFRRGLGTLLGVAWRELNRERHPQLPRVRTIIEELGFDVDQLPGEAPLNLRPRTPPGWRFAMTADGLGVFAPEATFEPDQDFECDPEFFDADLIAEALDDARGALKSGHAGTALWHARNAHALLADEGLPPDWVALLISAYRALGRDFLAERVKK